MAGVFISYRREDSEGQAGRLFESLDDAFGASRVFMDVDSIEIGRDYVDRVMWAIEQSAVMLVVIGRNWVDITDESGARRLHVEDDLVRREVATALQRKLTVIPVLVGGASAPKAADLPPELRQLARINAHELQHRHWKADIEELLAAVVPLVDPSTAGEAAVSAPSAETPGAARPEPARFGRRPSRRQLAVLAIAALLLVVFTVASVLGGSESERTTIQVGGDPGELAVGAGGVWVTDQAGGLLRKVDPKSHAVSRPISVGSQPEDVAVGHGGVWVASYGDDTVTNIDPRTRKRRGDVIEVGSGPFSLAVGDTAVWVLNALDDTLSAIDPDTREVTMTTEIGKDSRDVTVGAGAVWVVYAAGVVRRIDPKSGRPTGERIRLPDPSESIAAGEGAVWALAFNQDAVMRIDAETEASPSDSIPVGKGPEGLVVAEGSVWVSNFRSDTVTRIDASTSTAVGDPIEVGNSPVGIDVGAGALWVSNYDEGTVTEVPF